MVDDYRVRAIKLFIFIVLALLIIGGTATVIVVLAQSIIKGVYGHIQQTEEEIKAGIIELAMQESPPKKKKPITHINSFSQCISDTCIWNSKGRKL